MQNTQPIERISILNMHVIWKMDGNVLEIYIEFCRKDSASYCWDFYGEMYIWCSKDKIYAEICMHKKDISCLTENDCQIYEKL